MGPVAGICGLSEEVTFAVLPRLFYEELQTELNRRGMNMGSSTLNKGDLVSLLQDLMVEEYFTLQTSVNPPSLQNSGTPSSGVEDWENFKTMRRLTKHKIKRAHNDYLKEILDEALENPKKFWQYVKSRKQTASGVAPLSDHGELVVDGQGKAEILSRQYDSVFTVEDLTTVPELGTSPYPDMPPVEVTLAGVQKLLQGINPAKASGPDLVPCRILRDYATEISPILHIIFNQSLESGQVPADWRSAFINPIFKKGDRSAPSNYRPVSLTCYYGIRGETLAWVKNWLLDRYQQVVVDGEKSNPVKVKSGVPQGVILTHNLKWKAHINDITTKANRTLGFVRRNIRGASKEMEQHVRSHTAKGPFKCPECSFLAVERSELFLHIETHIKDGRFSCQVCGYRAATCGGLTRHRMSQHLGKGDNCSNLDEGIQLGKSTGNEKTFLECQKCSYCTTDRSRFEEHVKMQHKSPGRLFSQVWASATITMSDIDLQPLVDEDSERLMAGKKREEPKPRPPASPATLHRRLFVGGTDDSSSMQDLFGDNEDEWENPENRCGCGCCHPDCCQCCASPKLFAVIWAIVCVLINTTIGYRVGILATLEKTFDMESKYTGIMYGGHDAGYLIMVLLVSYYGGKKGSHRPKWIAYGTMLIGISCVIFALPYFFMPRHVINEAEAEVVCTPGKAQNTTDVENCKQSHSLNLFWYIMLTVATFMMGIGGAPALPLGTTYIDDHVTKESSPLYIGLALVLPNTGNALGLLFSSFVLRYYVDFLFVSPSKIGIDSSDDQWIGAWWLGFLPLAAAFFFFSLPLCLFPKKMKKPHEVGLKETSRILPSLAERQYLADKGLFTTLGCLFSNSVYVLILLGIFVISAVTNGFSMYIPKYLEIQFSLTKANASALIGIVVLPATLLGTLSSGVLMRLCKVSGRNSIQLLAWLFLVVAMAIIPGMFLYCEPVPIAGIMTEYGATASQSGRQPLPHANLQAECNKDCVCPRQFTPVCGPDKIMYFNQCFAGCKDSLTTKYKDVMLYTDCSCISPGKMKVKDEHYTGSVATNDCNSLGRCNNFIFLMIVLLVVAFVSFFAFTPIITAVLRVVNKDESTLATGMIQFAIKAVGVAAPFLFGMAMDFTCIYFSRYCDAKGACLVYDIDWNRYLMLGVVTLGTLLGSILLFCAYIIHRSYRED
ncbi:SLCO3A1 [Branchiostoma lanceolatum]|nr:SLCO3A1 [Branchiostoma lanceolatum]